MGEQVVRPVLANREGLSSAKSPAFARRKGGSLSPHLPYMQHRHEGSKGMKINKLAESVGIAAVAIGIAAGTVSSASAASNIKPFGQPETLLDPATGFPTITYTVEGMNPSSDAVPHNGQLYEAAVN